MTDCSDAGRGERRLTVIHVRQYEGDAEVMFVESARIYRLPRRNPAYASVLDVLHAAVASGRPVMVRFDAPNGEQIEWAGETRNGD
ncbi:MAG: hypothetical protein HZC22_15695 [Rhodocyclales bacterium]|nr:hypothetical protein [Rhodocyclales bacterium]